MPSVKASGHQPILLPSTLVPFAHRGKSHPALVTYSGMMLYRPQAVQIKMPRPKYYTFTHFSSFSNLLCEFQDDLIFVVVVVLFSETGY